jgi:hypothetical protein
VAEVPACPRVARVERCRVVLARSSGLQAPFVVAGVVIPAAALLCLPVIDTRTVAAARAAAGLDPAP